MVTFTYNKDIKTQLVMNGMLGFLQFVCGVLTSICTLILMVHSMLVDSNFKCASVCIFAIMFAMCVYASVITYREYKKEVRN